MCRLIGNDGNVMLSDFGIAEILKSKEDTMASKTGSPAYMCATE